ncbi:MAG: hypothetical protein EZS28_041791 [Streblomastix strix]|uniref:Dolichol-phosphate mannosyltransferase subunit 3 n=1 Tax=Streblomastix strix TaxID=222440 RepID=A0A5J4TXX7_9EUKA|nr:MAG: hypothetical protein EZS28_041791 [Streblomastix strix]
MKPIIFWAIVLVSFIGTSFGLSRFALSKYAGPRFHFLSNAFLNFIGLGFCLGLSLFVYVIIRARQLRDIPNADKALEKDIAEARAFYQDQGVEI